MDDLPQQLLIENYPVNVELLDNRTGEIIADAILISISDIMGKIMIK